MMHLTPKQIVSELDRYIVGQADAKRAVAIAIRNRWRRQQLPDDMRQDVSPKNIITFLPVRLYVATMRPCETQRTSIAAESLNPSSFRI